MESGGVVRRMVAVLGLDFKKTEFDRAELGMQKLRTTLNTVVGLFVGGAVARGVMSLVKSASDVNETINVIDQAFGEHSQAVQDWAASLAGPIGRSQYMLREFAGATGAILEPMVGSQAKAAEMSMTLSQLAVDLGSFFNATDEDALRALQSGIVGQTEPLRRFGVVLLDSTLQEYARSKGISTSVQNMTNAQKVELRYQYILEKTTKAQGDAIRTATGYANASKALRGALRDASVAMGAKLLPMVEQFVGWATKAVKGAVAWLTETNVLSHAFQLLAAAGGIAAFVLSAKLLGALGGVASMALKAALGFGKAGNEALLMQIKAMLAGAAFIALIGVLFLLWDEFQTMMEGGETVFGDFNNAIEGLYDNFMSMDLSNSPLLRGLRFFLSALKDTKDMVWATIMALRGDMSGFRLLRQRDDETAARGLQPAREPGLVDRAVGKALDFADNMSNGALMRLRASGGDVSYVPAGSAAATMGYARPVNNEITLNQTIHAAPGQSERAVGDAAGRAASRDIEKAMVDRAKQDVLPLAPIK